MDEQGTPESVKGIAADAIAKDRAATAEREEFINSDLSGLKKYPAIYKSQLGSDKSKWPSEAKAIVRLFELDVKMFGPPLEASGDPKSLGGSPASEWKEPDNRSGANLIAAGLKRRKNPELGMTGQANVL